MIKTLIILCSSVNIGDLEAKKLVTEDLIKRINFSTIYEIDTSDKFNKIILEYQQIPNKEFIISFGEKSLDFLQYLNKENLLISNSYIGAVIHQYDYNIETLPLSYLSIPEAVINSPEKQFTLNKIPKYTLVYNVPTNNPSVEDLKKSYDMW